MGRITARCSKDTITMDLCPRRAPTEQFPRGRPLISTAFLAYSAAVLKPLWPRSPLPSPRLHTLLCLPAAFPSSKQAGALLPPLPGLPASRPSPSHWKVRQLLILAMTLAL